MSVRNLIRLSAEVERALNSQLGPLSSKVVLLESAILTHGMPYPHNLNMAKEIQELIRDRVKNEKNVK